MSFINAITPKDTEEVKPGLFIQEKFGSYRQVHPGAWNGKVIWKNFIFGGNPIKHFILFLVLMFIVFSYQNDVGAYRDFYEEVSGDRFGYCEDLRLSQINPECTIQLQKQGLCTIIPSNLTVNFDFSNN